MSNFFTDNEDLQYYFDKGIDWTPIVELTETGFRNEGGFDTTEEAVEFYRQFIEMFGEFVAEQVAPHSAAVDRHGVRLEDGKVVMAPEADAIFKQIKELELHGMCIPRELGGMNCPLLLYLMNIEVFSRADVSMMTHHGFHGGMAMAMLIFSLREGSSTYNVEDGTITDTRFHDEIQEILRGDAWGCMDITEPDAGSDMARLKAVGEQDEEGNWLVSGEKIFITSGHGKYHFVIARTEKTADPDNPFAGLKGLSMFLVPTYEDNEDGSITRIVSLERVEEKLGHHGSATATLIFDRTPAHLIGQRGEGFKHMLTLMNNARLGVGFEALGLCEAAYRLARDYAAERPSMGKTIDKHEMIADYLDEMKTDIQAIRAIAMKGAMAEEESQKIRMLLQMAPPESEAERERYAKRERRLAHRARRITPLLKYLSSEKAVQIAQRCVQIHGGNGYMKEYGAEKLLRDAMVMPIYEGTSQIQALMAMKDTLGSIMKNPQRFVRRQAQARWRSLSCKNPLERRVAKLQSLSLSTQQFLMTKTATNKVKSLQSQPISEWPRSFLREWDPKRDFAFAMLHAERLTRILTDEVVCETLLEQAMKHPERGAILEAYLDRCEPRCRFMHDEITTTGRRLLSLLKEDEGDVTTPEQPSAVAAE
ncbi:MAG: acyl-CoA dehydrogenase family protein [Polyangiaceae bacterium]